MQIENRLKECKVIEDKKLRKLRIFKSLMSQNVDKSPK